MKLSSEQKKAVIGKILSPHGVGGLVKVFPYSDFPERVSLLNEVELLIDDERSEMFVEQASVYGRFWLIKFQGVDSRGQAYRLMGGLIRIPLNRRFILPEGSFYHDQLVGLKVLDAEDNLLGQVVDINVTGGHDLLIMEPAGKKEKKIMIPAVKAIIRQVDLKAGRIVVELPEGLLDLEGAG